MKENVRKEFLSKKRKWIKNGKYALNLMSDITTVNPIAGVIECKDDKVKYS